MPHPPTPPSLVAQLVADLYLVLANVPAYAEAHTCARQIEQARTVTTSDVTALRTLTRWVFLDSAYIELFRPMTVEEAALDAAAERLFDITMKAGMVRRVIQARRAA